MKKRISILLLAVTASLMFTGQAFAGTWCTDGHDDYYVEDNAFVSNDWIADVDGNFYAFDRDGKKIANSWVCCIDEDGNYCRVYAGDHGAILHSGAFTIPSTDFYYDMITGTWVYSPEAAGTYTFDVLGRVC